jgi:hypothetical protein
MQSLVIIERSEDEVRLQLAWLHAFAQQFRTPRGVVFRAEGELSKTDVASGELQPVEGGQR